MQPSEEALLGAPEEIETQDFLAAAEEVKKEPEKFEMTVPPKNAREAATLSETWYCVHCQKPTPKRLTVIHGKARVCLEYECVRVAVLEDRYSELYKKPVVEHRHTKA